MTLEFGFEITAFGESDDPDIFILHGEVDIVIDAVCIFLSQEKSTGITPH